MLKYIRRLIDCSIKSKKVMVVVVIVVVVVVARIRVKEKENVEVFLRNIEMFECAKIIDEKRQEV